MNKKMEEIRPGSMLILTDGNIDQASARVRAISYIPLFESEGFKVVHIPRVPCRPASFFQKYFSFPVTKRLLWLKRIFALLTRKWNIIYIQRLLISEWLMRIVSRKSFVIFDFDDAIYLPEKPGRRSHKTGIMINYADKVIVSTEYLNDFVGRYGKKAIVIPSPVETDRIFPMQSDHTREIPVIGWIGSYWTTGYIKIIEPALQKLAEKIHFTFLTVGSDPAYKIAGINHVVKPWSLENECSLVNEMDIGIMPLPDDEFTRAKGGYKLYLYMSAGIPCVASPVGINSSIIRHGENGFLASSENEWIEALSKLLSDSELRKKMGSKGREDALNLYDRKVCFSMIMNLINQTK